MKYVCSICGYIYDEAKEKIPFSELPESWVCPVCKAPKSAFIAEKTEKRPSAYVSPESIAHNMEELTPGAVSALFSSLSRGCEKQYKQEEAELFQQLSDYFASIESLCEKKDLAYLLELVEQDLTQGYTLLREKAQQEGDRGTQRICVWGEKVTNMQKFLLDRYLREGEEFLKGTRIWVCSVCGFIYIGDGAPELCPVCKVPSWKFDEIEGRHAV